LATNLKILKNFGHDLELYVDPTSKLSGRQLICKGNGGRIDLLCCDRTQKRYVVIELKNVRAGQNTFGQISNYMGWVQNRIARNVPVIGIVISRGYDTRFESALKITDKISHINVEDLGFAIAPSKEIQIFAEPREKDTSPSGIRFANSREAKTWLKKGNTLFEETKYEEAIACYDRVLEKDPKNKWAWINKGSALAELTKHEDAILCFEKAVEMYPKSAHVWHSKGLALNRLDMLEEAIIAFDRVIELKPKLADPWNDKGIALGNMERCEEAILAFDKAIEINPQDATAWNYKGITLYNLKKYDNAIRAYDRAIELDTTASPILWSNKGSVLVAQEKYDNAIKAFDEATRLDPTYSEAWNSKGVALKALGRTTEANDAFAKAKELGYTS
jgi:tetratricopeptide (TPR) repeat protein